jgi:DNA-binding NarL/FixJ family response regulator
MLRVVIVDRRPAMRRGYRALLAGSSDLMPVGCAAGRGDLWPLAYRCDPDIVLVGDPEGDTPLALCLAIGRRFPRTRRVVAADDAGLTVPAARRAVAADDALFAVPAAFARVDGIVAKAADERALLEVLRGVGRGEPWLPPVTPAAQKLALTPLGTVDRAIVAMRLAGTPDREIAKTVGVPCRRLGGRLAAILAALREDGDRLGPRPDDHRPLFHAA